jgi:hypothetical protein
LHFAEAGRRGMLFADQATPLIKNGLAGLKINFF